MILLIDNYDSFSYNLYQLIGSMNNDIRVVRNDEMSVDELRQFDMEAIVLSPGPGRPKDAGICMDVVREFTGQVPILGVCLGHQCICEAYGGVVSYAKKLMHGKTSVAKIETNCTIFRNMNPEIVVGRYHSLAAVRESLPACLQIVAETKDQEIMAVRHKQYPVYGLQFHPESILTPDGKQIISNFLELK